MSNPKIGNDFKTTHLKMFLLQLKQAFQTFG